MSLISSNSALAGFLERRQQRTNSLLEELCAIWEQIGIPHETWPSRLQAAEGHLKALEQDMLKQEIALLETKSKAADELDQKILSMCAELQLDVQEVMQQKDGISLLQKEKMLKQCAIELENEKHTRFQEWEGLKEKDRKLAAELYLSQYSSTVTSVPSLKDLKDLKDHVKSLQQMKKDHMDTLYAEVRRELDHWWDEACVTQEERKEFTPFFEEVSDDNLEILRDEVARLQVYCERSAEVLTHVKRWVTLWESFKEHENKATDPDKYKNRGGALLQEQKRHKHVMKELPKVEEDVKDIVESWERMEGQQFRFGGLPFVDYVHSQRRIFEESKQSKKELKQKMKTAQLRSDMKFGSRPGTPQRKKNLPTNISRTSTMTSSLKTDSTRSALRMPTPKRKVDGYASWVQSSSSQLCGIKIFPPHVTTPQSITRLVPTVKVNQPRKSKDFRRRSGLAIRRIFNNAKSKGIKGTPKNKLPATIKQPLLPMVCASRTPVRQTAASDDTFSLSAISEQFPNETQLRSPGHYADFVGILNNPQRHMGNSTEDQMPIL